MYTGDDTPKPTDDSPVTPITDANQITQETAKARKLFSAKEKLNKTRILPSVSYSAECEHSVTSSTHILVRDKETPIIVCSESKK